MEVTFVEASNLAVAGTVVFIASHMAAAVEAGIIHLAQFLVLVVVEIGAGGSSGVEAGLVKTGRVGLSRAQRTKYGGYLLSANTL
jgi:hypothetical protein